MRSPSVFVVGVDTKGSRGIPYGPERGVVYLGGMLLCWSVPRVAMLKKVSGTNLPLRPSSDILISVVLKQFGGQELLSQFYLRRYLWPSVHLKKG